MKNLICSMLLAATAFSCSGDYKSEKAFLSRTRDLADFDEFKDFEAIPVTNQPAPPSDMAKRENAKKDLVDDRKIIKTASVNFEVEDVKESARYIEQLVQEHGGYFVNANLVNNTYQLTQHMTVRVKPERMDSLLDKILEGAVYISEKNIQARDVTEEFVDIKARLKSKRAVADQYTALLKKAKNVEEIMIVEEQLRIIREEIEAKEGRLKYLANQVVYSTVHLSFYEQVTVTAKGPTKSFFAKMGDGFTEGWNLLLVFVIGMVYVWPLWLAIVVVVYFLRKRWLRRKVSA